MDLYTQRHGMRKPIEKTYEVSLEAYSLLYICCEKYLINLAWKFPDMCSDGYGCCGLELDNFNTSLRFSIPTLFRNQAGYIDNPLRVHNVYSVAIKGEYDQYALFDYIEYIAYHGKDVVEGNFHSFLRHHHYDLLETREYFEDYNKEINNIFKVTGLQYQLTEQGIIERIVENSPLTHEMETDIIAIKEETLRNLLQEAVSLFKQPAPHARRDAAEKIWDAFERLKTYYTTMDKKSSANTIIGNMANNEQAFIDMFTEEFSSLTDIGNNFRIRHHETSRTDIVDPKHFDYFFNRCLSLIALAIQHLK